MKLSVAMITLNEEKKLEKTLRSIVNIADEIVIVDSGSIDRTKEIAVNYKNVKFLNQAWLGFGKQKNFAMANCTGEWVLILDADEELSKELQKKIIEIINSNNSKEVYKIKRVMWCFGRKTRHIDYAVRLIKNGSGQHNEKEVHEEFITSKEVGIINEIINHHTYADIEEYFNKFNKYTTLAAIEMKKRGKRAGVIQAIINSFFKFIKKYIIKAGFLDGYVGLLNSILSSFYNFIKYMKLKELYDKEKFNSK